MRVTSWIGCLVVTGFLGCGAGDGAGVGPAVPPAATAPASTAAASASGAATVTPSAAPMPSGTAAAEAAAAAPSCDATRCEVTVITDAIKAMLESFENKEGVQLEFTKETTNDGFKTVAKLPWLRELLLRSEKVTDVSVVAKLTQLRKFDAYASSGVTDIRGFEALSELTELSLYMTKVADIAPVAKLTKLELLNLYATEVTDIAPIAGLTALKELNLYMVKAKDWTPVSRLVNLEDVWLQFADLKDLKILEKATKLRKLRASWCPDLGDVGAVANMPLLEDVGFADLPISDIKPLARLAKLQYVDLSGTKVKDFSPLKASAATLVSLSVPQGTPAAATQALTKANPKLDLR
jgi:hypothetical protein